MRQHGTCARDGRRGRRRQRGVRRPDDARRCSGVCQTPAWRVTTAANCMRPSSSARGGSTPLAGSTGARAVTRMVALLEAGKAAGGECAFGVHMVGPQTVEAETDEFVRHRAAFRSRISTPPTPPALDQAEAVDIGSGGQARRVDNDRSQTPLHGARVSRSLPTRILLTRRRHETRRLHTAASTAAPATGPSRSLATTRRRRGVGSLERLLGIGELNPPPGEAENGSALGLSELERRT